MGWANEILEAKTLEDLKAKARAWSKRMRDIELEVIHGWERSNVFHKADGSYRIWLHAHT
jgi:hypothetical protein